jgi:hypothetical protein
MAARTPACGRPLWFLLLMFGEQAQGERSGDRKPAQAHQIAKALKLMWRRCAAPNPTVAFQLGLSGDKRPDRSYRSSWRTARD